jgi:hypothetical protein
MVGLCEHSDKTRGFIKRTEFACSISIGRARKILCHDVISVALQTMTIQEHNHVSLKVITLWRETLRLLNLLRCTANEVPLHLDTF